MQKPEYLDVSIKLFNHIHKQNQSHMILDNLEGFMTARRYNCTLY